MRTCLERLSALAAFLLSFSDSAPEPAFVRVMRALPMTTGFLAVLLASLSLRASVALRVAVTVHVEARSDLHESARPFLRTILDFCTALAPREALIGDPAPPPVVPPPVVPPPVVPPP